MPPRVASTLFAFGLIARVAFAADGSPIPPEEAQNRVGKEVVVEMTVVASKNAVKQKKTFLDSKLDINDPDNLGVAIGEDAVAALKTKHATDDVAAFFRDKTVRVTGTIVRRDGRTYLDVEDADRLRLVE